MQPVVSSEPDSEESYKNSNLFLHSSTRIIHLVTAIPRPRVRCRRDTSDTLREGGISPVRRRSLRAPFRDGSPTGWEKDAECVGGLSSLSTYLLALYLLRIQLAENVQYLIEYDSNESRPRVRGSDTD